ncbi:NYN domain-containing protein [Nocardioides silvaticus]|uniref:NYN domain-containing protein n=1 Tax=Nocardioides silvaticus TaxID=2201891 RepID=A0A316TFP6_9ACTN|nr:NYN domain-containing protein [Nocardioides silvaticus]PWN01322.1 NYN domain-containing protein [Nocardioides silvaticus]
MDAHFDPGDRRLVLIDIENVVGGLVLHERAAGHARCSIEEAVGTRPMDQVVVATCHKGYPHVAWTWPSARRLVRSGQDGADLELLDVLDEEVADHFEHVVLVSGDGIFTDAVTALERSGVRVTIAARRGHLSGRLRLAASEVVYLNGTWEAQERVAI